MLKPLENKIIVKVENTNETKSGIVLSSPLEKDTIEANVFSVSDKIGKENIINIGDKVIIQKFSGSKFEYDDNEYITIVVNSILAVIKEE